jgi:hypothetical protein
MDVDDLRRDVARRAEDAAYVAIGMAVLEFQKAQVRRRALQEQLGRLGGLFGEAIGSVLFGERSSSGESPKHT